MSNNTPQTQYKQEPKAKLGGLYEKQSAKGFRYFVGYFGGFKLLVMPEKNPEPGKPEWAVFAVERSAAEPGQRVAQQPPTRAPQAHHAQGRQGYQPHGGQQHGATGWQQEATGNGEGLPY